MNFAMTLRSTLLAATLVTLAALGGCGEGSSDPEQAPPPPPDECVPDCFDNPDF